MLGALAAWRPRHLLRFPFLLSILPSALFYVIVFGRRWIPIHDTFQEVQIIYTFFNDFVRNGVFPLWYPYMQFGLDTNWYVAFSMGPAMWFLLPFAKVFSGVSFLHVYYAGMLLDELCLLAGGYLLARTLFRHASAAVFVCLALGGSQLWYAQPWFNFHMFYFLPLSFYFVVTGCRESVLWRVLAGGALLMATCFGNLPYMPVVQGLTFAVFTVAAAWAFRLNLALAWRKAGWREAAVLGAAAFFAAAYLGFLKYGVEHINYNQGREDGNRVDPDSFLTYGGSIGLNKFSELFTGTSWNLDINVYAGVLVLSLAVFGLLWAASRRQVPFLATGLFVTALSLGSSSFIAPLVYFIPGVDFFRHLGLIVPIVKVLLIFLAGFGLDAVASHFQGPDPRLEESKKIAWINMALLGGAMAVGLVLWVANEAIISLFHEVHIFNAIYPLRLGPENSTSPYIFSANMMSRVALVVCFYAAAIGVFLAAAVRGRPVFRHVVPLLLLIQLFDVYSYRYGMFHDHMVRVGREVWNLFQYRDDGFADRRISNYFESENFTVMSRSLVTIGGETIDSRWFQNCIEGKGPCYAGGHTRQGTYYNTLEPFLGLDTARSIYRVDYWLPGIDSLYRAKMGLPLKDLSALPPGAYERAMVFPRNHPGFNKVIAADHPKFQLFRALCLSGDEERTALVVGDGKFAGDLLLADSASFAAYRLDRAKMGGEVRSPVIDLDEPGDREEAWVGLVRHNGDSKDMILEGYKGFNVVGYRGKTYALHQQEGAFHPQEFDGNASGNVLVAGSLEEMVRLIDRDDIRPRRKAGPVRLIQKGLAGRDLYYHDRRVYAVPAGEEWPELEALMDTRREDIARFRTVNEFLAPKGGDGDSEGAVRRRGAFHLRPFLSATAREEAVRVEVSAFNSNAVTASIKAPPADKGYWLYYADAWHPFWRVLVNGKEAPILKANFGFKAIEIPGGVSVVEFRYGSGVLTLLLVLVGLLEFALMGAVLWLIVRILFGRDAGPAELPALPTSK